MAGVESESTVLVVLRGNSGSGKSFIARMLRNRRGLAVVSPDVLRREVLGVEDGRGNPAVGLIDLSCPVRSRPRRARRHGGHLA